MIDEEKRDVNVSIFPTIEVDRIKITKIGKLWCIGGGDGEMYPVVGQEECEQIYQQQLKECTKQ